MSLHGLYTDEWFNLVRMNILCYIDNEKYSEAKFLLIRYLDAHISKTRRDLLIQIAFLGLKFSLIFNDLEGFVSCIKMLA